MGTTSVRRMLLGLALFALIGAFLVAGPPTADAAPGDPDPAAYWTAARRANAVPRDLVLDGQGQAYLRRPDGTLAPYGGRAADGDTRLRAVPGAKPENPGGGGGGGGGGGATNAPTSFDSFDPAAGGVVGASHTFRAGVSDADGIKSVTFLLTPQGGSAQSFSASLGPDGLWTVTLQGFQDGQSWTWQVSVKDGSKRGGVTETSEAIPFTVEVASDPDPEPDPTVVVDEVWTGGGSVQAAAGRIYFEMPTNGPNWGGYVCSGTVADDGAGAGSVVITAAHCVYDDVNKVFARNVLFIPNQAGTTGAGTDTDCDNDPVGCWAPSHGVVDDDWTTRTFPDNIPWDYAYYVVPDTGAHSGAVAPSEVLDQAVAPLTVQFSPVTLGAMTHALGYSYSDDPEFRYCAEGVAIESSYDDLWLSQCGLSGGSSGGPWLQPVDGGNGPIVSVNSWGYTNQPGMAGPPLSGAAGCVFDVAVGSSTNEARGIVAPAC